MKTLSGEAQRIYGANYGICYSPDKKDKRFVSKMRRCKSKKIIQEQFRDA